MRKRNYRMQGAVFWAPVFFVTGGLFVCGAGSSLTEGAEEIEYVVSFVDTEDNAVSVFAPQGGSVPEGTVVSISFPEQIIGSDGHIWTSTADSPQEFPVYQYGVHKYFIEYQQGEKVKELEPETEKGSGMLASWIQKAREADCRITGEEMDAMGAGTVVRDTQSGQEERIRGLVSQIKDTGWHTFYLIGKNHEPQTVILGTEFDSVYSVRQAEEFRVGEDWYQVTEVRVRINRREESCRHNWESEGVIPAEPQRVGSESFCCSLCGAKETVRLAQNADELLYWKEGEVQMRELGDRMYRFVCVDEDYEDHLQDHGQRALFLCDSVIRSDLESTDTELKCMSFGADNNYKTSNVFRWLETSFEGEDTAVEPVPIGVTEACLGSTEKQSYHQLTASDLQRTEIGYQQLSAKMFLLSVEEALRYREKLWSFGREGLQNPETQISAYSQGYYLRTPLYEETQGGFVYGSYVYGVDLVNGNIHPVPVDSETYGLRPAFSMKQGS